MVGFADATEGGSGGGKMGTADFYTETISGSSMSVDFDNGYFQEFTLNASVTTLSFSNGPDTDEGKSVILDIVQGTGGSKTITWPATIKWDSDIEPTLSTAVGEVDRIALEAVNDGATIYYGHLVGSDMS
jgi:hypothetical protein